MTQAKILNSFKKYQKASASKRRAHLDAFEEKMIYRTTKTENPQTTLGMVQKVLSKFKKS